MKDLICNECGHKWSMEADEDGLFNGYGCPPCPKFGCGRGVSIKDYGDFRCNVCGYKFRRYGNGGLRLGMIPSCPKCGGATSEI